jgi:hypothetical protein
MRLTSFKSDALQRCIGGAAEVFFGMMRPVKHLNVTRYVGLQQDFGS